MDYEEIEHISYSGTNITLSNTEEGATFTELTLSGQTKQNGTPTPDAPVKVQTVTGECSVKVSGANGQSQSFSLSLGSLELCKIGDYEDSIFEKDGTWYKKAVIKKYTTDGNGWAEAGAINGHHRYICQPGGGAGDGDGLLNVVSCYSTHFKGVTRLNLKNINEACVIYTGWQILTDEYTTVSDFKTWAAANKPTVYYVLATPTTTEITDATLVAQLNALRKAKTYAGTTTIVSTGSLAPVVWVEVEKPEVIPNKNVIYLKLEDGVDRLRLYTLEAPVSSSPIINETDVVTSDGNLSTYYGSTKQQLTFRFGYMTADEYARLLDIRDRQYKNLKYPKVTIRNAGNLDITKMPAKLTLGSQNIIDNCGNVQDVDLTLRESKEVF